MGLMLHTRTSDSICNVAPQLYLSFWREVLASLDSLKQELSIGVGPKSLTDLETG